MFVKKASAAVSPEMPHMSRICSTVGVLHAKGTAATTRSRRLGVVEDKPLAVQTIAEVQHGPGKVKDALGVNEHSDAVLLQHGVGLLRLLFKPEHVGESGAASALYAQAKTMRLREIPVRHKPAYLGRGLCRQGHPFMNRCSCNRCSLIHYSSFTFVHVYDRCTFRLPPARENMLPEPHGARVQPALLKPHF